MNKAELNSRPKERRAPRWRGDYYFSIHCLLPPPSALLSLLSPFPPPSHLPPPSHPSSPGSILCLLQPSRQPLHSEGEKPPRPHLSPPPSIIHHGLHHGGKSSFLLSLSSSQRAVHCLSLTPSQMANLCDLVIISLKQAAMFGLEVVKHSEAEAFQPPERLKQWH